MRKKKKALEPPFAENYTIFHALFDAVKDKESKKSTSLFNRLRIRKKD